MGGKEPDQAPSCRHSTATGHGQGPEPLPPSLALHRAGSVHGDDLPGSCFCTYPGWLLLPHLPRVLTLLLIFVLKSAALSNHYVVMGTSSPPQTQLSLLQV